MMAVPSHRFVFLCSLCLLLFKNRSCAYRGELNRREQRQQRLRILFSEEIVVTGDASAEPLFCLPLFSLFAPV